MYLYYFLAGLGPEFKKYLWWKKYLTMMQIVILLITDSNIDYNWLWGLFAFCGKQTSDGFAFSLFCLWNYSGAILYSVLF